MMNDMNMEGEGPSLDDAYHSVIELLVGAVSTVPIVITFAFSYTKQFTDPEWFRHALSLCFQASRNLWGILIPCIRVVPCPNG